MTRQNKLYLAFLDSLLDALDDEIALGKKEFFQKIFRSEEKNDFFSPEKQKKHELVLTLCDSMEGLCKNQK